MNPLDTLSILRHNARKSEYRHTLKETVFWRGRGVHSGEEVEVCASPHHPMRRESLGVIINGFPLSTWRLHHRLMSTGLIHESGLEIRMTEHLFAALSCSGIDDVKIEIRSKSKREDVAPLEFPILDGSAGQYIEPLIPMLTSFSPDDERELRTPIIIQQPLSCTLGQSEVHLLPNLGQRYASTPLCAIEFELDQPPIPQQTVSISGDRIELDHLVNARTFGLLRDEEPLRGMNLIRGVTYDNTTVFDDQGIALNSLGTADDPARHKILDLIGDLYCLGRPLDAVIHVHKGGHALNHLLIESLQSLDESVS